MNIELLSDNSHKFYGCKYRSDEEEEVVIKRCSCQGGDYKVKGFSCHQRNLFQLTPDICAECEEYEPKK
jgi:hypothetical protein